MADPKKTEKNNNNNNNNNQEKKELTLSTTDFEELTSSPKNRSASNPAAFSAKDNFLDEELYQKNSSQYHPSSKTMNTWDKLSLPRSQRIALSKLKVLIRAGIPDKHRKKVWCTITGAAEFQSDNPTFFVETMIKVFGDDIPKSIKTVPLLGGTLSKADHPLKEEGFVVVKRLLAMFKTQKPNLDFVPSLPDTLCILLCFMNEEEAFLTIWRMCKNKSYYWNTSRKELVLFCHTFQDLIKSTLPKLDKHFKKLGLPIETFEPWFSRLYIGILPHQTALRVFDAYLSEGYKILYRVGLAILSAVQKNLLNAPDLSTLKQKLSSTAIQIFDADHLMKIGFSFYLARSQFVKLNKKNKNKVTDVEEPVAPIYYRPKIKGKSKFLRDVDIELIWEWLPNRFKICDAQLLFCSSEAGYNLKSVYKGIEDVSPVIIVIKTTNQEIFGMFLSSALEFDIKNKNTYYGRRDCFLFSLKPNEKKYPAVKDGPDYFLQSTSTFFGFGGGNGTSITLNEDLIGTSQTSDTFKNPPLASGERGKFEVSVLEAWAPI